MLDIYRCFLNLVVLNLYILNKTHDHNLIKQLILFLHHLPLLNFHSNYYSINFHSNFHSNFHFLNLLLIKILLLILINYVEY